MLFELAADPRRYGHSLAQTGFTFLRDCWGRVAPGRALAQTAWQNAPGQAPSGIVSRSTPVRYYVPTPEEYASHSTGQAGQAG